MGESSEKERRGNDQGRRELQIVYSKRRFLKVTVLCTRLSRRVLADLGDEDAGRQLARWLAGSGQFGELRQRAAVDGLTSPWPRLR